MLLAFREWINLLKTFTTGEAWPSSPLELTRLFVSELPLEQYQLASRILASEGARRFIEASGIPDNVLEFVKPPSAGLPVAQWPAEYQKAAEWMQSRSVMTVDEVKALAESVVPVTDANFPAVLRQLRNENIALANSENTVITDRIRNMISGAVEDGRTFRDFIDTLDEMVKDGQVPEWSRAYAETVYRTETANAYGAQRDWLDAQPIIANQTWGYEFFNPDDDRSNDSHAAMDGVIVQWGSPAELASHPGPPWFYNCRCDRLPILVPDPATETGYAESPDAYAKVLAILRF